MSWVSVFGGGSRRWKAMLLTPVLAALLAPAQADRIITVNGQTLDGIIRDENAYYVEIDVRGVEIPVPRDRIQSVTRNTLDENARALLDRAFETLSRDEIPTARTLIEQARSLNSPTPRIQDDLAKLDAQITDLERRGGTAEDRRIRSETMLRRAQEQFDKIRNEEGNQLLIQALRIDPTYIEAQTLIEEKLSTAGRPDYLLAAEYFVDVLWPDNVNPNSPVIPLLAPAYVDLANRFGQTLDVRRAQRYAELLTILGEAFEKNPAWTAGASAEARALVAKPVVELLSAQIETNLTTGDYEFALDKMKGWANPTDSEALALLYARAYVGAGQYDSAASVLAQGAQAFPSNREFQPNTNALSLLRDGDNAAAAGRTDEAIASYEKIFANRSGLVQEITVKAGNTLSNLKFEQMNAAFGQEPRWRAADLAALVMVYSTNRAQRFRAAEVLNASVQTLSWKLRVTWYLNGVEIPLSDQQSSGTLATLGNALAVRFDDASPFVIDLAINATADPTKAPTAVQTLSTPGGVLPEALQVTRLDFKINAMHPILGPLLSKDWDAPSLPAGVAAARQARGEVVVIESPAHLMLVSSDSIQQFSAMDLGQYIDPNVTNLALHLRIQMMSDLLRQGVEQPAA